MHFIDIAKSELKFQKHLLKQFDALRKIKDGGQLFCKRNKNGYTSYYIKEKTGGRKRYVRMFLNYSREKKLKKDWNII